jgi:hypothetical protein
MPRLTIDTLYRGYRFRSRLEARWAVFLDALGWAWAYEVEGYTLPSGRYLPDFLVRPAGTQPFFLEIKPERASDYDLARARNLCEATQIAVWILEYEQPPLFARDLVLRGYRPGASALLFGTLEVEQEIVRSALRAARAARFEFEEKDC